MEVPKKKVKDKEIIRSIEFVIIYIDFSEIYMKNVFFLKRWKQTILKLNLFLNILEKSYYVTFNIKRN